MLFCIYQDGETAIHAATKWGNIDCLQWLLENTSISPNHRSLVCQCAYVCYDQSVCFMSVLYVIVISQY